MDTTILIEGNFTSSNTFFPSIMDFFIYVRKKPCMHIHKKPWQCKLNLESTPYAFNGNFDVMMLKKLTKDWSLVFFCLVLIRKLQLAGFEWFSLNNDLESESEEFVDRVWEEVQSEIEQEKADGSKKGLWISS